MAVGRNLPHNVEMWCDARVHRGTDLRIEAADAEWVDLRTARRTESDRVQRRIAFVRPGQRHSHQVVRSAANVALPTALLRSRERCLVRDQPRRESLYGREVDLVLALVLANLDLELVSVHEADAQDLACGIAVVVRKLLRPLDAVRARGVARDACDEFTSGPGLLGGLRRQDPSLLHRERRGIDVVPEEGHGTETEHPGHRLTESSEGLRQDA